MAVGLRTAWDAAPPRLRQAAQDLAALRERDGVHLFGVRHHSPACAVAVAALIEEVRPAVVLVEGPEEYTRLLPALLDERTVPPVAVLSLAGDPADAAGGGAHGAGFYPLARYSPEWVALRAGHALGAQLAFVDSPWAARGPGEDDEHDDPTARTVLAERHLAHSRTVARLAERLGCRDHDELWDHLFEARDTARLRDWRELTDDVFAWAALARLDYEDEVLLADGSLDREARMSARVAEHAARAEGPVVVVTGAFHTLALVEALTGSEHGEAVVARRPEGGYGDLADAPAWLVRYDDERLDALRGYGAGMPTPGYYDRLWAAHHDAGGPAGAANGVLVDVGRRASARGALVSVAQSQAAVEHAHRLAALRERPWPCRTDLLDAITSCYVKDADDLDAAGDRPLGLAVAEVFAGRALGDVPPGGAAPPLVEEARSRARALRLDVSDSVPRTVRLDARRRAAHRDRRRFLALCAFLDLGFARRVSGPDHVAGRGLGLVLEEWEYAWTPLVEARLVELSHRGAALEAVAVALLDDARDRAREERSSDAVARLVAQCVVVGLPDRLPPLVALVRSTLDVDPSLASVVAGMRRLVGLWRARAELELGEHAEALLDLAEQGLATAAYLVPDLAAADEATQDDALTSLVALRSLVRDLRDAGRDGTGSAAESVARALAHVREDDDASPAVRGALTAFAAVDDELDDEPGGDGLVTRVRAHLAPGADPVAATAFLAGVMRAAPDLLLHTPEMFDAVDDGLRGLDEDAFRAVLPDLRRAFTWLRPTETHRLAERVAARTGTSAAALDRHVDVTEDDLRAGLLVERELVAVLERDGLGAWARGGAS
ncbi:DUF5682 family protein [Cellulosimicrobium cellulans]|uniref:DUF5682 family protein n=1 Tax=Cellulosimicrobium cellulans TaxID=1710 RepID=UPI00381E63D0